MQIAQHLELTSGWGSTFPADLHPFCMLKHPPLRRQRKCFLDFNSNTSEEPKPLSKPLHLGRCFAPQEFEESLRGQMQRTRASWTSSLTFSRAHIFLYRRLLVNQLVTSVTFFFFLMFDMSTWAPYLFKRKFYKTFGINHWNTLITRTVYDLFLHEIEIVAK